MGNIDLERGRENSCFPVWEGWETVGFPGAFGDGWWETIVSPWRRLGTEWFPGAAATGSESLSACQAEYACLGNYN